MLSDQWITASESGDCVEARLVANRVEVRNSKRPAGAIVCFTPAEWRAFVAGVRRGLFDLPEVAS